MKDSTDLPLFQWAAGQRTVALFPLARQVGAVQAMADNLIRLREQSLADEYWRQNCNHYIARAMASGATREAAEDVWIAFYEAVYAELRRRNRRRGGGGAA